MTCAAASASRWVGHGFGLCIDSGFAIAGCRQGAGPAGLPRVRLETADAEWLRRRFPTHSKIVAWSYDADGNKLPEVRRDARAGYLLESPRFGAFQISARGRSLRCAPRPAAAAWRWQRYVVGQVLPFAAALRGFEPWHASAVALEGEAIALVGHSRSGKSSLAAALILRGATFLADDVIALEPHVTPPIAHPGLGLMSLRRPAVESLGTATLRRLGVRVGADADSVRLAVPRCELPLPLRAVYLLEPSRTARRPRLVRVRAPDPRRLLSSTFNLAVDDPVRLIAQLDVCATVARSVRISRALLPPEAGYAELADRLLSDLGAALR